MLPGVQELATGHDRRRLSAGGEMPRKGRELVAELLARGFEEIPGGGKGSHRTFVHDRYPGAMTISGQPGDDAKPYQEKQVRKALEVIDEKTDAYHKWVEWSDGDAAYIGKCPDLISGIHGDDPVRLYADLISVVDEVIAHFQRTGRQLPVPRVRPMQDVG